MEHVVKKDRRQPRPEPAPVIAQEMPGSMSVRHERRQRLPSVRRMLSRYQAYERFAGRHPRSLPKTRRIELRTDNYTEAEMNDIRKLGRPAAGSVILTKDDVDEILRQVDVYGAAKRSRGQDMGHRCGNSGRFALADMESSMATIRRLLGREEAPEPARPVKPKADRDEYEFENTVTEKVVDLCDAMGFDTNPYDSDSCDVQDILRDAVPHAACLRHLAEKQGFVFQGFDALTMKAFNDEMDGDSDDALAALETFVRSANPVDRSP